MREILIACGDVELLKQLIAELPAEVYKPIATKRGAGIAHKISGRGILEAIVHDVLEDGTTASLVAEMRALEPAPKILLLCEAAPPADRQGADVALRYPCPGPVLRHALQSIAPETKDQADLEGWRLFFRELKQRNTKLPALDYYAIMSIPRDAPHHQLVKSFDALSLRYHPDRYNQFRSERWGEAIYQEANTFYKVATEAYGILSDRKMRALYDKLLTEGTLRLSVEEAMTLKNAGPKSVEDLGTSQASRRFLKLAQTDIATMSWTRALQNLRFALSMEPENQDIQDKIAQIEAKL